MKPALIAAVVIQALAMAPALASDRTKPYLTADAQAPAAVAHQNESELAPAPQAATRDEGTEQLEKLLLHSALTDSSAFGLLQALQQPIKAAPAATDSSAAKTDPRKKT